MHIFFLTPAFPPMMGGGEHYACSLAHNLQQRGHQVTVVTSAADAERALWAGSDADAPYLTSEDGIAVWRCPVRPFPGGRTALLLWRKGMVLASALPGDATRLLTRMARFVPPVSGLDTVVNNVQGVDVVHSFNLSWEHAIVVAHCYSLRHHLPHVITPFAHFGEDALNRVARNSTMDHQRHMLENATAVQILTQAEAIGFAQHGFRLPRTDVVGAALDPVPTPPPQDQTLIKHKVTTPFVLFVGRASYDKGATHAVAATLRLRAAGFPLTLVLVGQQSPEFRRYYERLATTDRDAVHHLGALSDPEKFVLLRRAVALLLPSRTDSFGMVILEAWSQGTPVVAADAGGIRYLVGDRADGFLVPFGDVGAIAASVRSLLADPDLRGEMGRAGQVKVERQYTWAHVTNRVLDSYRRAMDHHHAAAAQRA